MRLRADERAFLALNSHARIVRNLLSTAGETIEQRGFAAVGRPHERDTAHLYIGIVSRHVASRLTAGSVTVPRSEREPPEPHAGAARKSKNRCAPRSGRRPGAPPRSLRCALRRRSPAPSA